MSSWNRQVFCLFVCFIVSPEDGHSLPWEYFAFPQIVPSTEMPTASYSEEGLCKSDTENRSQGIIAIQKRNGRVKERGPVDVFLEAGGTYLTVGGGLQSQGPQYRT